MDTINNQYLNVVQTIHTSDKASNIEEAIRDLMHMQTYLLKHHPEFIDSITDVDYHLACAAFRINRIKQFEKLVQRHYYDDFRFKRLYQSFLAVETTNAWNNIIKSNASNMEKTFVRSLSVIILTGVCLSLILRK